MKAPYLFVLLSTSAASAQFQIDWYTIDGGGGSSAGGSFSLTGTVGQHDAATSAAGAFQCAGGFWSGLTGPPACYPNCDGSTTAPALNANDFICFIARFSEQSAYANCDGSTTAPALNANDFICFINAYTAGCQ